jgi:hypothetical protein
MPGTMDDYAIGDKVIWEESLGGNGSAKPWNATVIAKTSTKLHIRLEGENVPPFRSKRIVSLAHIRKGQMGTV